MVKHKEANSPADTAGEYHEKNFKNLSSMKAQKGHYNISVRPIKPNQPTNIEKTLEHCVKMEACNLVVYDSANTWQLKRRSYFIVDNYFTITLIGPY